MGRMLGRVSLVAAVLLVASGAAWAQGYDLRVVQVEVVPPDCFAVATIANVGTEALPNWAFDDYAGIGVKFLLDGQPMAGYGLGSGYRTKLQAPGSQMTYTAGGTKISGAHTVTAVIDPENVVQETDEANNTLSVSVQCAAAMPDIQVQSVEFTQDCKIRVVLRNAGGGALTNYQYDNLFLQRAYDGHPGGQLRPKNHEANRGLAQPGATLEVVETLDPPVTQWVEYAVHVGGDQQSQDNKTKKAWLTVACGGPGDPNPPADTGTGPKSPAGVKINPNIKPVPLKPVPVKPVEPVNPKK